MKRKVEIFIPFCQYGDDKEKVFMNLVFSTYEETVEWLKNNRNAYFNKNEISKFIMYSDANKFFIKQSSLNMLLEDMIGD